MNYEWTGDIWAMPALAETESGGQWAVHLSERKPCGRSHHREPVSYHLNLSTALMDMAAAHCSQAGQGFT